MTAYTAKAYLMTVAVGYLSFETLGRGKCQTVSADVTATFSNLENRKAAHIGRGN